MLFFFLGSSVVEVGLIKKNSYFDILKRISSDYKNKKIHYYPHRKESPNKLKDLEDLGFKIIKNNQPFEILFLSFNNMPHIITSIYISGVLDNISKRYKNISEEEVQQEIDKINKNLSKIEKIKKFIIIKDQFTIENNMMTPTLKLKRYKIIKKYQIELEKLY